MAKTHFSISVLSFTFFLLFIIQCFSPTVVVGEQSEFGRRLSGTKVGSMKEKLSHFRFYFHDILSGQNPTAVIVVRAPNSTSPQGFGFGATAIIDNALTIGPELNSTLVGRAQGLYATASQTDLSFLMAINFVFIQGKYNGSTLSIFGRNPIMSQVREMPIIGGTGLFRFAKGYVQARTQMLNIEKNGDATVEYNVYVIHY